MARLGCDFFARGALEVAPDLLGAMLVHRAPEGVRCGMVVETEAYCGVNDPASHAYGGRRTPR
ncbi:MAG TPA: DNA-3-methyladenine glycosylase, partial [Methanomassiliicoccaceae archaeon]|nr:DNA-3-methyladenine glycosylase [Methanomassiliicoccaceae archaeon]